MAGPPGSITMVVPYVEGGGSDQRARLVARFLARHLNQSIHVVNRTGAVVGHTAIAQAAPDGSTIGLITGEIGMMHWHRGLTDLTWRSYTPLAVPFVEAAAVIVATDSPCRDLPDFVGECKMRAVIGSGGPHFGVWKFALAGLLDRLNVAPTQLNWIETYSGEQGLAKVLAREADVAPITMTDARGALHAGAARALATMEDSRHPDFPDVPTVAESIGVDWSVAHWRGFVAPAGLSDDVSARFCAAFRLVEGDPEFRAAAAASSFTLRWRHGSEFQRYMMEDDEQFGRIIRLLGINTGVVSTIV